MFDGNYYASLQDQSTGLKLLINFSKVHMQCTYSQLTINTWHRLLKSFLCFCLHVNLEYKYETV